MKLKYPDKTLADYLKRTSEFWWALRVAGVLPRERLLCIRQWDDVNSPFTASEKLKNLLRALEEEGL